MRYSMQKHVSQPNILFLLVDQERFPAVYDDDALRVWRQENLRAQDFLRENGLEFENHYTGSTACSPSRGTLYTGQYPSLHGVSQTTGAAKVDFEPDMFWLDPNTVPTIGDYFSRAGYNTFWKGKWHASQSDILIPDTQDSYLTYNADTGVPLPENEAIYTEANRLGGFGFNDWIGPEPFSDNPRNSGASAAVGLSGRDVVYADEVVELINELNCKPTTTPWFISCSLVNPHDIALFGAYTRLDPLFNFDVDPSLPFIPKAPTADEDLSTKPTCQASYREVYPLALQPLADTLFYRQLYYTLQLKADRELQRVLRALTSSRFYENTIVVFTADHGEVLGAHGGLYQKWYQAYEESIHVPLIIHNPRLFDGREKTDLITSHVDLLPTLLGLANIDEDEVRIELKADHTEAHPLVGRDLAPFIKREADKCYFAEPIYYMTDDDFTKGLNETSVLGVPYVPVTQPNSIETIITLLPTGEDDCLEKWKYNRYFDNPQFWTDPGCKDVQTIKECCKEIDDTLSCCTCITKTKNRSLPDQIEFYNLTTDPLEERNLADPQFATPESEVVRVVLQKALEKQCRLKRLYPTSGLVPGRPSCSTCAPDYKI